MAENPRQNNSKIHWDINNFFLLVFEIKRVFNMKCNMRSELKIIFSLRQGRLEPQAQKFYYKIQLMFFP